MNVFLFLDKTEQKSMDFIPEAVEAIDLLIADDSFLSYVEVKYTSKLVECFFKDWCKLKIINEIHLKHFITSRQMALTLPGRHESNAHSSPWLISSLIKAEVPLIEIRKALSSDYSKVQDVLVNVLSQILVGM